MFEVLFSLSYRNVLENRVLLSNEYPVLIDTSADEPFLFSEWETVLMAKRPTYEELQQRMSSEKGSKYGDS